MSAPPPSLDLPPYPKGRLDVRDLALARGDRPLARGVAFALEPGEAILLRGANGSGKTTLLRTLAGFTPKAGGEISLTLDGADVFPGEALAYLGHADGLRRTETPRAHLGFINAWLGADGACTARAIDYFKLGPIADAPAQRLSAGQRRRAALARLIAAPRPIWLLDEPAAPLDAAGRAALSALVAAHRAAGGAVIAAVHDTPDWPDARELRLEEFVL
ncbi:MAG: heme ABC exporter ATP-binding protein CcmA [Maricaulaceae bacterium]|jgi:heme exporter protein A